MEPCQTVTLQESDDGKDCDRREGGEAGPLKIADNMKDLKMEFNSADDIRQAMKAIIGGTMPSNYNEDDSTINQNKPKLTNPLNTKTVQITEAGLPQRPELLQKKAQKRRPQARSKAVPKKKKNRQNYIERMYIGKLSNVVPFKNRHQYKISSESESDVDSILFGSC